MLLQRCVWGCVCAVSQQLLLKCYLCSSVVDAAAHTIYVCVASTNWYSMPSWIHGSVYIKGTLAIPILMILRNGSCLSLIDVAVLRCGIS